MQKKKNRKKGREAARISRARRQPANATNAIYSKQKAVWSGGHKAFGVCEVYVAVDQCCNMAMRKRFLPSGSREDPSQPLWRQQSTCIYNMLGKTCTTYKAILPKGQCGANSIGVG